MTMTQRKYYEIPFQQIFNGVVDTTDDNVNDISEVSVIPWHH
jgi:hypothetical protein